MPRCEPCAHREGWAEGARPGEMRCPVCGVRRFRDYGAVRPPGLAHVLVPSARRRGVADRAAARSIGLAMAARSAVRSYCPA
ncbi:hypothetical protein LE181_23055 [Streptomyces sp. SCA3-4]|uniref:DUF6255 family natural product biosynthesis protein n=1 Tax=Streptomyces sichuanensis TaxID=2871810 RepID=UPI001CE306AC|nr:hypothetical protein [Streptomyces sichuanensis]